MILLSEFALPFRSPVLVFSIILLLMLLIPFACRKLGVPALVGLIVAGMVVGPHGFNLLRRDSSIVLFGTVGLLYIMFRAALEINVETLKRNAGRIATFGISTFLIPLIFGTLGAYFLLQYSFTASILLAAMFSSHTVIAFPVLVEHQLTRHRAVALTVGGTLITDVLALVVLAGVSGTVENQSGQSFWIHFGLYSALFLLIVLVVFPLCSRFFFRRVTEAVPQYIFVLSLVLIASFLAEAAGLEPIIGAFMAGLSLERFIPEEAPLRGQIHFVGDAIFIPFFLISVGMLVDLSVILQGWATLKVAALILVIAITAKYVAAQLMRVFLGYTVTEAHLLFGLSTSHAAATLAIALVGYNLVVGETAAGDPIRLFDDNILNGTILLILLSCTIGSLVVQHAARRINRQRVRTAEAPARPA